MLGADACETVGQVDTHDSQQCDRLLKMDQSTVMIEYSVNYVWGSVPSFALFFHTSDFVPVSVVDRKVSKSGQSGLVFSRAYEKKYSTKTFTDMRKAFPRALSTAHTARTTT
jgi:hypothetical protein